MNDLQNQVPQLDAAHSWESRAEKPIDRRFFEFQFEVAKILSRRSHAPLNQTVGKYAPFIIRNLLKPIEAISGKPEEIPDNILPEIMLDAAYKNYTTIGVSDRPIPYHEGRRFGCFAYDYHDKENAVELHFFNAEFDSIGPLSTKKISARRAEITNVMKAIRRDYPEAIEVRGRSWLYNFDAYQRLFPESYISHMTPDKDESSWIHGTRIWGQFMDSDNHLREDMTEKFLASVQVLPVDQLMSALPAPPMIVSGPITDFYKFYGIE